MICAIVITTNNEPCKAFGNMNSPIAAIAKQRMMFASTPLKQEMMCFNQKASRVKMIKAAAIREKAFNVVSIM